METTTEHRRWMTLLAFAMCLFFSAVAAANADAPGAPSVSVEQRAKAAEAYDQGTSAYLTGRYELAAHWFERAYRLVPTSTALLQAVRAHYKAGNSIRAANLALQLRDEYPNDEPSREVAESIIASMKSTSVLVKSNCEKQCTLELDGALIQHPTFFVTPDVEHSLKAAFDNGETSTYVQGAAGDVKNVAIAPPAPPPPPPVPRWAFFSSLGATVALGAVTVWSGIDANNGVSAYESAARTANSPGINGGGSPTPEQQAQSLLDEGQRKERRTNILIGVTAGMAATTAVLGVFTNWKGKPRETAAKRLEPSIGVGAKGGSVSVKGRF
jgi:tetratricopeptide (TPR) repeat protein